MARYEHLPIYKATFDLACEAERAVRAFSRYNKYTLGTDLRNRARALVDSVIEANGSTDRARVLKRLRGEIESFKVLVRLCQEVNAFSSSAVYLGLAERAVGIGRQNEGWLRYAAASAPAAPAGRSPTAESKRPGEAVHGGNLAG